jgi:hypothetical protein
MVNACVCRDVLLPLELIDFISPTKNWFNEVTVVELLKMISSNLFCQLSPTIRLAKAQCSPECGINQMFMTTKKLE